MPGHMRNVTYMQKETWIWETWPVCTKRPFYAKTGLRVWRVETVLWQCAHIPRHMRNVTYICEERHTYAKRDLHIWKGHCERIHVSLYISTCLHSSPRQTSCMFICTLHIRKGHCERLHVSLYFLYMSNTLYVWSPTFLIPYMSDTLHVWSPIYGSPRL